MPTYSFAEPKYQTNGRWHVRLVGSDGLYPSGGLPAGEGGLCGIDLAGGWDIVTQISTSIVGKLLEHNGQARSFGGQVVCKGCAVAFLSGPGAADRPSSRTSI